MPRLGNQLLEFVTGLSFNPKRPETFWEAEDALKALVRSNAIGQWLNSEISELARNPNHAGKWRANDVVIHSTATWSLSLAFVENTARYIHALPFLAFYVPLAGPTLSVRTYRIPNNFRNDLFDPSVRLETAEAFQIPNKEVLRLQTDQFAYDICAPERVALLRLKTCPVRPMEWLFSRTTMQAWQANDGDIAFTRLRVAAHVLGRIAHQSSIEPLRQLSSHPHHAVRWAAIQNLGRLSRSEALVKIEEAVNDPHPHLRRAAQKTLDQLKRHPNR